MSGWVDMELDDESQLSAIPVIKGDKPVQPRYPYGLRLCFCDGEIAKLGLEDDVDVGDYIIMKIRGCVTSASANKMDDGSICKRVELQVEQIKPIGVEDDDEGGYG